MAESKANNRRYTMAIIVLPYGAPDPKYVDYIMHIGAKGTQGICDRTLIIVPSEVVVSGTDQTEGQEMVAALKESGWGGKEGQDVLCLNAGTSGQTNLEAAKAWIDEQKGNFLLSFVYDRDRRLSLQVLVSRVFPGRSTTQHWFDFKHTFVMKFYLLCANLITLFGTVSFFGWVDPLKSRLIREGRDIRALVTGKARLR